MRILFLAVFLSLWLPAYAADPLPDAQAVESYLNGITTVKADFVQTANDGQQVAGVFLLKRPGKMRFDYLPPITDFIVADGLLIYYYDGQMKQQSSMPISRSLADFFLREKMQLSGDITVNDIRREDEFLQVTLVQARDPYAGSLTLMLSEGPLQLKKWRVVDAQGLVTTVELTNIEQGLKLNNKLFHYYTPGRKEPNINK